MSEEKTNHQVGDEVLGSDGRYWTLVSPGDWMTPSRDHRDPPKPPELGGPTPVLAFVITDKEADKAVNQSLLFATTEAIAARLLNGHELPALVGDAVRKPEWDKYAHGGVPDNVMREEGWWEGDNGQECEFCELHHWESIPASSVCYECRRCMECHDEDCETNHSGSLKAVKSNDAATILTAPNIGDIKWLGRTLKNK